MKYLMIFISVLILQPKQGQVSDNAKAKKLYLKSLGIVKGSINNQAGLSMQDISDAIVFFEKITNLKSESNGNFLGRFEPTQNDYDRWAKWYKINKNKIYWNRSTKEILLLRDSVVTKD